MISRKKLAQMPIQPTAPKTQKETALPKTCAMKKKEGTQLQNGTTTISKKNDMEERETPDEKKQKKASFVTKRKMEPTDELEQQLAERKQRFTPKGQIANSVQKQSKTEEKNKTKSTIERRPGSGINPLDTILDEIEAFDTANKKNKKAETENDEVNNVPCSSRQLPPTPMPGSYRSLNRMELARQDQDHSMVKSFLDRNDLMQRILAYKMLKGRVESYSIIRVKIDLDNCAMPDYELSPTEFDKGRSPCDKISLDESPAEMAHKLNNLETSDQSTTLKRGPMTPPGSPGTNLSSAPEADAKPIGNLLLDLNNSSAFKKEFVDPLEGNAPNEMLRNFCSVTGISTEMIRSFLGDEFYKLDKLKMEDLMKTFLVSLKQIASKKDKEMEKECSSTKVMRSPVSSVVPPKDENKSIGSEGFKVQAEYMADDNFEGDAMEISSQSAVSSGTFSFSNGLLPPPPLPPPILDCTETVFIVPPPPPPLPPLHKSAQSSFPTFQQQFISSPLQQLPSEISSSNDEQSTPTKTNRASENPIASKLIDSNPFPTVVGLCKKFFRRPKTCDGNKRLKPLPSRFPKLKTLPRKINVGSRVGRLRQKVATTSMSTQKPISLLSLNLVEPRPEVAPKNSEDIMHKNNTIDVLSVPIQKQKENGTKTTAHGNQQPKPSREAPIVVDLEFIKNTPPPPIPDIIKRRTSSDNNVTGTGMLLAPIPVTSQASKFPPQSLLHMDLTRPPIFPFHRPPPIIRLPKIAVQPSPPAVFSQSTSNTSTMLHTIVRAIGCTPRPQLTQLLKPPTSQRHPAPSSDSPYGKFF